MFPAARGRALSFVEVLVRLPGLVALAMSISVALDLLTTKLIGYDLAAYILGARRLLAGAPLYQIGLTALGPFGEYVYPPPVAVLFLPLAVLPFDWDRVIGLVTLLVLTSLLIWWLVRAMRPGVRYWAAAATALFFPILWEVGLENLTLITLLLAILAWACRRQPRLSGLAFGSALGLKLLPLALVVFLIGARRGRILLWSTVWLLIVTLLTWPIVGGEWMAFAHVMESIARVPPGTGSNVVPTVFASPLLRPVLPALGVVIAGACGIAARRTRSDLPFRLALAAVPLLASTLWYPYLVFALPLLIATVPLSVRLPVRAVRWLARPIAWYFIEWQAVRDPGRDFILPLIGLLFLLAVGLLELAALLHFGPPERSLVVSGLPPLESTTDHAVIRRVDA